MGTWSTTAPINLATEWTEIQQNTAQGGYRVKISGNYVYLYYNCVVRACSAWLETGQLCVKIENYSGAIGSADPTNSLSTNAYITDESGTIVYADTNTSVIGNNTASDYGHQRGTYYYTYDTNFDITFNIKAGIRDNDGVYGNGTCGVTVTIGTKPSSGESGGDVENATASVQNLYIKINGAWHPILWG